MIYKYENSVITIDGKNLWKELIMSPIEQAFVTSPFTLLNCEPQYESAIIIRQQYIRFGDDIIN